MYNFVEMVQQCPPPLRTTSGKKQVLVANWILCHAAASMVPEIVIAVCPWEKRTLKGHCRMTPNCRIQKREAGTAVATIEIIKTRLENMA
jgi:hypothetical protein